MYLKIYHIIIIFVVAFSLHTAAAETNDNEQQPSPVRACNGSPALCNRSLKDVAFPGTHNSMSNRDDNWSLPNHTHGIDAQLEYGIRAINMDLYMYEGEPYLCHTSCNAGRRKLSDALSSMKHFMERNPNEVIILWLEDAAGAENLKGTFENSGILEFAHIQTPGALWPTLGEMIDSGKRLVIMGGSSGPEWYLRNEDFLWSSPWNFRRIKDFECGTSPGQELYLLQHFILNPYPMEIYAKKANNKKTLMNRAVQCWQETGQRPNIIIVDFYDLGDLIQATSELNSFSSIMDALRH